MQVQCLVPVELSACFPVSCLVVHFLAATWEIHCVTYIASHIVAQDAPELHQVNGVLPLLEDAFLHTKYFVKILQGFWIFLIVYHTLQ